MRILYDHQVFSLQNAGGASRYHYELARYLSGRAGVEIHVQLGVSDSVYPFASLKEQGAHILAWRSSLKPGLFRYALNEVGTGAISGFSRGWEIYHPTLYRTMPTVRGRHIVVTHHDCTHERFPELFSRSSLIRRSKRKLFSAADAIICVSESASRDLRHYYGIDEAKIRVIHHGIRKLVRKPEEAQDFISRLRRPFVLYVGTRHSYKNFLGLLEAYKPSGASRDFDLVCIGGGSFTNAEELRIDQLGLRDRVLLFPRVSETVLAEAYARAHLFVYPSLYEGFGFPPLEAMSCGCPVLAADSSSIPEICQDAALYFDPRLSESLTAALGDAIGSRDREQQIIRGLAQASRYDWAVCAERTLKVYRQL